MISGKRSLQMGLMVLAVASGVGVATVMPNRMIPAQTVAYAADTTVNETVSTFKTPTMGISQDGQMRWLPEFPQWPATITTTDLADSAQQATLADAMISKWDGTAAKSYQVTDFFSRYAPTAGQYQLKLQPNETVLEFLTENGTTDVPAITDPVIEQDYLETRQYATAWFLNRIARLKAGTLTVAELKEDLSNTLYQRLSDVMSRDGDRANVAPLRNTIQYLYGLMSGYLVMKQDQAAAKVTAQYDQVVKLAGMTALPLTQLDPDQSVSQLDRLLQQPVTQYLTKQADGTDQVDGQLLGLEGEDFLLFSRLAFVTPQPVTPVKPSQPVKPVTPVTPKRVPVQETVVMARQKVGLYRHANFKSGTVKRWYQRQPREQQPLFRVIGYARSTSGRLRYRVRDINHRSKTWGQTGYLTANDHFVVPAYYQQRPKQVTVQSVHGVTAYRHRNLTGRQTHYRQGRVLNVKRVVRYHLTTRLQLTNGRYVTANKQLVQAGWRVPRVLIACGALNRYTTPNLRHRNRHYPATRRIKLRILGWTESSNASFSRPTQRRYRVAGGYVTANPKVVRVHD